MAMQVRVVENGVQLKQELQNLQELGFAPDNIYVLTHDDQRTHHLAEKTDANEIGFSEAGMLNSIANLFRSKGEELRSKMESMGLSEREAELYEQQLDRGRVLIIARD